MSTFTHSGGRFRKAPFWGEKGAKTKGKKDAFMNIAGLVQAWSYTFKDDI